jgi:hypothetical protein
VDDDPRTLSDADVHGFREHYDPWTGRAWLEIRGPRRRRHRIGPGYGALRRDLRARWPDRPFDAEWDDGSFPASPLGLPPAAATALGTAAVVAATVGLGLAAGPVWGIAVALLGTWPVVRGLDGVEVTGRGIRVGPPWALTTPWHAVQRLGLERRGRAATLWMIGARGGASGTVPAVLVPAVRARIQRLGGLELEVDGGGLDRRYAAWRPAAAGIPWGVGLATLAAAPFTGAPFVGVAVGGGVAVGLALLGGAVEARATGWGTGAVVWLTLLYALILGLVSVASWWA